MFVFCSDVEAKPLDGSQPNLARATHSLGPGSNLKILAWLTLSLGGNFGNKKKTNFPIWPRTFAAPFAAPFTQLFEDGAKEVFKFKFIIFGGEVGIWTPFQ